MPSLPQEIPLLDGPVEFQGAVCVEQVEEGLSPFRLRHEDRDLLLPPRLLMVAEYASGVRLVFRADSPAVELELAVRGGDDGHVDLVLENELVRSEPLPADRTMTLSFPLPERAMRRVELWLPQHGRSVVSALRVEEGAAVEAVDDSRPRWITYGSSITQCRQAHSPARTWPAVVARREDLNLTNLGLAGQCCFDPVVARTIAALPAEMISLELGVNTYGQACFTRRTWTAAVVGFLLNIRDGHPDTPLLVASPIAAPGRERTPNKSGLSIGDMREMLAEIVENFRGRGDDRIHFLDGRTLLGPEDAGRYLLPDKTHPTGDGYETMGQRFDELVFGDEGAFSG